MKKKFVYVLFALILAVGMFAFAGCGGEPAKIEYQTSALPNATVGLPYTASIATATGAEIIKYELKKGSDFPTGFSLSESGEVSGTPLYASTVAFTVVASADGMESAEAEFRLVIEEPADTSVKYEHNYYFEAEEAATADKAAKLYGFDAQGGGFVDFNSDGVVTFNIQSETAAEVNLSVCLGTINAKSLPMGEVYDIYVNDAVSPLETDAVAPRGTMTGSWDWHCWTDVSIGTVTLKEGENTIKVVGRKDDGKTPLCLDYIALQTDEDEPSFSAVPDGKYYISAESGTVGGAAEIADGNGANGGKYVDFHGMADPEAGDTEDHSLEIKFTSNKEAEVDFYICLGIITEGGYDMSSVYTITVDGEAYPCTADIPGSGTTVNAWYTWTEIPAGKLTLKEGETTIRFVGGMNARCLDYLMFVSEDTELAITVNGVEI